MTFAEYAERWKAEYGARVKPATLQRHQAALELAHDCCPPFFATDLRTLDDDDLAMFVDGVETHTGTDEREADRAAKIVKRVLRKAADDRKTRRGVLDNWQGDHVTVPLERPAFLLDGWPADVRASIAAAEGRTVAIDRRIAPLIRELWRLEIATEFSCESMLTRRIRGGRAAWINFGDPTNATALMIALALTSTPEALDAAELGYPPAGSDGILGRAVGRGTDAWEWTVTTRFWGLSPLRICLYFPPADIDELARRLERLQLGADNDFEPRQTENTLIEVTSARAASFTRQVIST